MENADVDIAGLLAVASALATAAWVAWRYVWFYRNPPRTVPPREGIVSAADGTVVYVRKVGPGEPVVNIKRGLAARLVDIMREHESGPKLVIGVFMSPFDVHYNRAPISGIVRLVTHHPGHGPNLHMGPMHWRILTKREPYAEGSAHIVQNERTVTKIEGVVKGLPLSCYVVQIAAKSVAGIESYVNIGRFVDRGQIFGMIHIGSQVDVVVPWRDDLEVLVQPGQRVRAGETLLCV